MTNNSSTCCLRIALRYIPPHVQLFSLVHQDTKGTIELSGLPAQITTLNVTASAFYCKSIRIVSRGACVQWGDRHHAAPWKPRILWVLGQFHRANVSRRRHPC
ncbi:hypothetical protein XU18_0872 [Perkinsela sp. CCAP 1560/4]|nr:hypothetical protein XU18_0872 [Perkinsela sp. CCAP 1560/4]|eukprot:KNH08675.1 hypothetical protein XU18_0872 [Perkinsela sp. CCAP 1560/4]